MYSGFSDKGMRVTIVLNDSMSSDKEPRVKVECFCTLWPTVTVEVKQWKLFLCHQHVAKVFFLQRLLIYSSVFALVAQSGLMLSKEGARGK